ncbi:MAG: DUF4126 domain-containing protein [Candidatus Promineifilaceae bacterium]
MDILTALGGVGSAFGLSASAGLNAYIPLLTVALTARFTNWINLSDPYQALESWPAIIVLSILLLIETFVDKIPAVDSVNDVIQTFIRPAAGAVMFAANTNVIDGIHPGIAVVAGILLAGSVHATKGVIRPVVTASTAGTGNWFVSIVEDVIAFFASLIAILLPALMAIVVIVLLYFGVRFWYRRRYRSQSAFN